MKILFAISLLGIGAAAVLAFMTRTRLIEARTEKDTKNREIVAIQEKVNGVNAETTKIWDEWKTTMGAAKDEETAKNKLARETNELEDTLKEVKKQIEDILTKRTLMEDEIKAIIGRSGTPEEVLAKVEALKGETDALSQEVEALKKELVVHTKAAGESDQVSAKYKAQQTARLKAVQLGGRSATIVLVNPEFSFVVIRVGRNDGLTSDARLLVKREGVLIARLTPVLIEMNQTIADIDLKSVRAGTQILAGDQVVFETQ